MSSKSLFEDIRQRFAHRPLFDDPADNPHQQTASSSAWLQPLPASPPRPASLMQALQPAAAPPPSAPPAQQPPSNPTTTNTSARTKSAAHTVVDSSSSIRVSMDLTAKLLDAFDARDVAQQPATLPPPPASRTRRSHSSHRHHHGHQQHHSPLLHRRTAAGDNRDSPLPRNHSSAEDLPSFQTSDGNVTRESSFSTVSWTRVPLSHAAAALGPRAVSSTEPSPIPSVDGDGANHSTGNLKIGKKKKATTTMTTSSDDGPPRNTATVSGADEALASFSRWNGQQRASATSLKRVKSKVGGVYHGS